MRKKILVSLGIAASLAIGLYLAYATATNWTFTGSANYTYDSAKIDVDVGSNGLARLKGLSKTQDTQAELEGTSPNLATGFGYGEKSCQS